MQRFQPVRSKPHPINIALKYEQRYKQYNSMRIVAQEFCITRVRVWQMLNLLKLDKKIIDYLLKLTDPKEINFWTERKLRPLLRLAKEDQINRFNSLNTL